MNFLKTFWVSLLVTVAAAATYVLMGHGPITAGVLGTAALVWIIQGWLASAAQTEEKQEIGETIRDKVLGIVDEVNEFIDEEVGILNESLTQIQSLAKDAVTALSGSMRSLNHQVHMQSKLLHKLAGITADRDEDDAESLSLGQYVEDSQSVLQYFLDLLDAVEEMRAQYIDGLDKSRVKVQELNRLLESGASNAEARIVLTRVKTLLDRQRSLVDRSRLFQSDRTAADKAITRMTDTRNKLQEMRDVVAMNVEAFSTQSNRDVDEAVRSLQFEDIVTQLVADAQYRLDEMNLLVKALDSRSDHLKVLNTDEEPLGALEVVGQIEEDAQARIQKLRDQRSKPVDQSSMDEGSVELF